MGDTRPQYPAVAAALQAVVLHIVLRPCHPTVRIKLCLIVRVPACADAGLQLHHVAPREHTLRGLPIFGSPFKVHVKGGGPYAYQAVGGMQPVRALKLLDAVQLQGVVADVITYNALCSACEMVMQPE